MSVQRLYQGALQADAYAGFHHLYEQGTIYEVACWAHARRKFHEIHIAHASSTTSEAIERIAALYAIKGEIRGSTPEIRKTIRQARARPVLDNMRTWLEATLTKLSPKSDTAAAIRYALSRWRALNRYVDDGHLEIDNNAAERALRVVALGRKNFLFAGSDAGGERAAAMYSLLGSAKLNGLDPEIYLHQVLERIADHPISRVSELLPWNLPIATQPYPHSLGIHIKLCGYITLTPIHNNGQHHTLTLLRGLETLYPPRRTRATSKVRLVQRLFTPMETKTDPALICPKCGESIKLTESLAAPLVAATRKQYEQQLADQAKNFQAEKQLVSKQQEANDRRAAELELAARKQEQAVAQAVQDGIARQLAGERRKIAEQESARARQLVEGELKTERDAVALQKQRIEDLDRKLTLARAAETELLKKQQQLEDKEQELERDLQKGIAAAQTEERAKALAELQSDLDLKVQDGTTRISQPLTQIDSLNRNAEQSSQQAQGESLEVALEHQLRVQFSFDLI